MIYAIISALLIRILLNTEKAVSKSFFVSAVWLAGFYIIISIMLSVHLRYQPILVVYTALPGKLGMKKFWVQRAYFLHTA